MSLKPKKASKSGDSAYAELKQKYSQSLEANGFLLQRIASLKSENENLNDTITFRNESVREAQAARDYYYDLYKKLADKIRVILND